MVDFYLFITRCNNYIYISKAEFHRITGGGIIIMVVVLVVVVIMMMMQIKMLLSTCHVSAL